MNNLEEWITVNYIDKSIDETLKHNFMKKYNIKKGQILALNLVNSF